jgi:hypothetical protein
MDQRIQVHQLRQFLQTSSVGRIAESAAALSWQLRQERGHPRQD